MGAIITQMILDDGRRSAVYADGTGGAYTEINGQAVQLAQDENGNWVQLDPIQSQQMAPQVVTQPQVVVRAEPRHERTVWPWVLFGMLAMGIGGYLIYRAVRTN